MQKQATNIPSSQTHRLSVQISLNGLSFLITNLEDGQVAFFLERRLDHSTTPEELLSEIETVISENQALQSSFADISLIYATTVYSLVPLPLFDETKASEYLKFNSKILANDYIAHDVIETSGIAVVYVPFVNINNYFFDKYGSFSYYHSITVLLKSILQKQKYSLPKMYLHFQKNFFDCIVLKDGELQLCNSYPYKTPEDFIYYTLFCMEQLKLDPETLPVSLCGEIEEGDASHNMAYTYIRHLEFTGPEPPLAKNLGEDRPHNHYILKHTD